jgi:hypothetical protein
MLPFRCVDEQKNMRAAAELYNWGEVSKLLRFNAS